MHAFQSSGHIQHSRGLPDIPVNFLYFPDAAPAGIIEVCLEFPGSSKS